MNKPSLCSLVGTEKIRVAPNVFVRFQRESQQRTELAVIINDKTSAEQLRSAWPEIDRLRASLIRSHGSDLRGLLANLTYSKAVLVLHGATPREVAMETNFDCLVNLCRAVICFERNEVDEARTNLVAATCQLLATRMKGEEAAHWILRGFSEIRNNRAPWTLTEGPVDYLRVRDAVRQFKRELQSGKVVIAPQSFPPSGMVNVEELQVPINQEPFELAIRLLSQTPNAGGMPKLNAAILRQRAKWGENSG